MSQGSAPRQADLFRDTSSFVEPLVRPDSIHALLHRECHTLFPDELFSDLFAAGVGRRSVPPLVVAVVMVLQRLEGLSDREAVERFTFDARWKYACGGLPFDAPGFAHTVLVDMRARLARSDRPNRIFERTLEVARAAGLVGVRRVLDSTPLYDAVATMDTVTLVRSAIRGVLGTAQEREPALRAVLRRDDDYRTSGKPAADWDDAEARAALVDALARDGQAALEALEDQPLPPPLAEAAALLATVLGQDLEDGPDGRIRIARRVAPDRVISTVQKANGVRGHFTKDDFTVDLAAATVTCPAGRVARFTRHGAGFQARFRSACATCPLAERCTTSASGRRIEIGPHEALLTAGRAASRDPVWLADYRATRPKVERKLAHLVRRRHGGRRARVRGRQKVGADFSLLAAALNLARLAVLRVSGSGGTWAVRPA